MTTRYTRKDLDNIVARINRIMGAPMDMGHRADDGRNVAHVGHYFIDGAYGGVQLCRICNESGGVSNVLRTGHVSKSELAVLMFAFIEGIDVGRTTTPKA